MDFILYKLSVEFCKQEETKIYENKKVDFCVWFWSLDCFADWYHGWQEAPIVGVEFGASRLVFLDFWIGSLFVVFLFFDVIVVRIGGQSLSMVAGIEKDTMKGMKITNKTLSLPN